MQEIYIITKSIKGDIQELVCPAYDKDDAVRKYSRLSADKDKTYCVQKWDGMEFKCACEDLKLISTAKWLTTIPSKISIAL